MREELLRQLRVITPEERTILEGRATIDRELYMLGRSNTINAQKLLSSGKLITIRPHTRFIHFPEHTHDYVEVVYMCEGETTHVVNGIQIHLKQGELLFLNQNATHEVFRAEEGDVAVNFIVLPEYFSTILPAIGEEETPLRRFLVDCLCSRGTGAEYLHFCVSDVVPIQNLVENLIFTMLEETANKRRISQLTMTLLFLQLVAQAEHLETGDEEKAVVLRVLAYIESHYANGSLTELSQTVHHDLYWLSREIKRRTGKTYTQLVQEKRLAQAAFFLRTTNRNVDEIAQAVGYENMGYFHRIFREAYGVSPRSYRMQIR